MARKELKQKDLRGIFLQIKILRILKKFHRLSISILYLAQFGESPTPHRTPELFPSLYFVMSPSPVSRTHE